MEMEYQWEILEEEIPTQFKKLLQSAKATLLALQSKIRGALEDISLFQQLVDIQVKKDDLALYSPKELASEFKV